MHSQTLVSPNPRETVQHVASCFVPNVGGDCDLCSKLVLVDSLFETKCWTAIIYQQFQAGANLMSLFQV